MSRPPRFGADAVILVAACIAYLTACAPSDDSGTEATASVHGVVTDTSGLPIHHAVVYIVGTDFSTTTDSLGYYELTGLPVGRLQIGAKFVWHIAQESPLTLAPGDTVALNMALVPPPVDAFPDLLIEPAVDSSP